MVKSQEQEILEYTERLGPELGPILLELCTDLNELRTKWHEYEVLYAHSQQRVDLLNYSARHFFVMLDDIMWKDILLHLARLTDPPDSGKGKPNLTIKLLPHLIGDETMAAAVSDLVVDADRCCAFARDWRNRYLAHSDLHVRLAGSGPAQVSQLASSSQQRIADAVAAVEKVVDHVHVRYFGSQRRYGFDNGASRLIQLLETAKSYKEKAERGGAKT
ncbi:MAG: AbiU2 domain-containing protein [Anaerolineae bacterium]